MKKVIRAFFYLLILSFILPSGTFISLPIKTAFSVVLILLLAVYNRKFFFDQATIILGGVLIFLVGWAGLSFIGGYRDMVLSFLKNYFSIIFILWLTFELPKMGIISIKDVSKILGIVSIGIIAIKFFTCVFFSLELIKMGRVYQLFKQIFGSELTSMKIMIGPFAFYRVMSSNDHIPLVWFAFYLFSHVKLWKKIVLIVMMALYAFIVYSRVAIAEYGILLATYVIVLLRERHKQGKKDWLKIIIGSAIIVGLAVVLLTNKKLNLMNAIISRFSGESTAESDQIRNVQFEYLWNGFKASPIYGHGAGSYVKEFIRNSAAKYSYELEYLSFLYQFGVAGFLLVIAPVMYVSCRYSLVKIKDSNVRILIIVNLLIWLARPFFNPSFLSSNSAIIIVIIFAMSRYLDYEKAGEKCDPCFINQVTGNLESSLMDE